MPVAIRLSRVGTKHVPFFRVVVVDSRKKRDGEVIEVIGTYNALKTELVNFKADRYEDWLSKGAQPSDTAKKVYKLNKKQQSGKLETKVETKAVVKRQKKSETAKAVEPSVEPVVSVENTDN